MKVTVIGGAGVRTVTFINGLLDRYQKLNIDEVVLYDINQEKLQVIEKLCKHVVNRRHETLKVSAEQDVKCALMGASYVVTTLRVGEDHSRVIDETTALQNGVIGQETTGIGGFSMAARTIPALLEYCRLVNLYAPEAWIFNFTNPSGLVTQALRDAGYDRVIGICDAPSSTKTRIAEALNQPESAIYVEFFGLNHLSWIRSVKVEGKEMLPELLKDTEFLSRVQEFMMFDPEVFSLTGYLPNEYLYYYYHKEKALENILKSGATRGKTIEEVNTKMMEELKQMDIDADPEEALQTFLYYMYVREYSYMSIETGHNRNKEIKKGELEVPNGMGYAGVMLDCIEGMQSKDGKYLVLSVPNAGSIKELRDEDIIEITCKVSDQGILPIPVEDVPEHCSVLMRTLKMYENKSVEAIRERSKVKAAEALTLHPLIGSFSLAKKLIEDYDNAYNGLLCERR